VATHRHEILVFEVAGRRYGLPVAVVQELARAVTVTPVPGMPPGVEGVINVRGQVVPVFDLRCRFGLPVRPVELGDHLIVARSGSRRVALRVDRALEIAPLGDGDVENAVSMVPGVEGLAAVAKVADGLVLIADLDRLLADDSSGAGCQPAVEIGQVGNLPHEGGQAGSLPNKSGQAGSLPYGGKEAPV
jgi:purine-binding chemotaxis protein CheW